ncbi:MAG: ABC transporter ATP-binding protein, partial [Dehalococcoidia bacterium]
MDAILRIEDLVAEFVTTDGTVSAINHVTLSLRRGSTLAITGESGSGKTSLGLSVLNLLPHPGRIISGSIYFEGRDLLEMEPDSLRAVRGRDIAMVFQDPASGLNPVLAVGQQVEEIITTHLDVSKNEAQRRSVEVLAETGLPDAAEICKRYPYELSGGMAQRVMIAMALACVPELLIADEPTTALDVTIQAQILDLMRNLRTKMDTAIILITHDLGVVAEMCDRVDVMYAGRIVEKAPVVELFQNPKHPYTAALIGSTPVLGEANKELTTIPGSVPNLINLPLGCKFAPRCEARIEHNLEK